MIPKLMAALKGEPALLAGLGTAVGPVLGLLGVPKTTVIILGGLAAAIWAIVVRMLVMPTPKVVTAITNAAHAGATAAVAAVDATTAGVVGQVLPEAATVAHTAAEAVVGNVLQDVGLAAGAHKA